MARPPVDANPEQFVIGQGMYSNLQIARPFWDDRVFRIDPTPMPVRSIIIYNLVFAAFSYGFHWVAKYHTNGEAGVWGAIIAPIGIGAMTCIVFTAVVCHSFAKAGRRGPWLVFNKASGRVDLPREGVSFCREEIVHIEYITTKRLDHGGVVNNERVSEVNLIACRNGERRRWPLLRSIFTDRAFDRILRPLARETGMPVMRVEDEWWGWKVTERPYGGDEPRS